MLKPFISGLLLGSFLTIIGGLLIGPTVIIGDQQARIDSGGRQRYDLRIDEDKGRTRYSIVDTENGTASIFTEDGERIVLDLDADSVEK